MQPPASPEGLQSRGPVGRLRGLSAAQKKTSKNASENMAEISYRDVSSTIGIPVQEMGLAISVLQLASLFNAKKIQIRKFY